MSAVGIDELKIEIEASSKSASTEIDKLIRKLTILRGGINFDAADMSGIEGIANSFSKLGAA